MRSRVGTRSADVRVTCDTGFREEGRRRKKRKERKEGAISDESRRMGKFMLLRDTSGVTEECKRKAGGEAGVKGNRKTGLWSDLSFLLQTELAFFPRNTALFHLSDTFLLLLHQSARREREAVAGVRVVMQSFGACALLLSRLWQRQASRCAVRGGRRRGMLIAGCSDRSGGGTRVNSLSHSCCCRSASRELECSAGEGEATRATGKKAVLFVLPNSE